MILMKYNTNNGLLNKIKLATINVYNNLTYSQICLGKIFNELHVVNDADTRINLKQVEYI